MRTHIWIGSILVPAAIAVAQPCQWANGPEQQAPGLAPWGGGSVNAQILWDPDGPGPLPQKLVVAGSDLTREHMGPPYGPAIMMWDGELWESVHEVVGRVDSLAVFQGDLIAAGRLFIFPQPVVEAQVLRFDGQEWSALPPTGLSSAPAMIVHDQHLYAAGANSVRRWDGHSWSQFGTLSGVSTLVVHDGDVHAGGGSANEGLVWRRTAAEWDPLPALPHRVTAIASIDSQLLAGTSQGAVHIWDGTVWLQLGSDRPGQIETIIEHDGELVVATSADTQSEGQVWRWNGNQWILAATAEPHTGTWARSSRISTAIEFQNHLHIGGDFWSVDRTSGSSVAWLDGSTWRPLGRGPDRPVHTFGTFQGQRVIGGSFTVFGGSAARGIALRTPAGWTGLGEGVSNTPQSIGYATVHAVQEHDGTLVAGGFFSLADSNPVNSIATWNGSEWASMAGGVTQSQRSGTIRAIAVYDGAIVAGGRFERAGGTPASNIARWDGTAWQPLGMGIRGDVRALLMRGDDLYAGGSFDSAGGQPADNIARWDGTSWHAVADGFNRQVGAMTEYRGELIAGGSFSLSGTTVLHGIARWSGNSWHPLPGEFTMSVVGAMDVKDDILLLFGGFEGPSAGTRTGLLAWNGQNWFNPVATPAPFNNTFAITHDGDSILLGGMFTSVGDQMAWNLARLTCDQPCYANCDGSTTEPILTVNDFTCFVNAFAEASALPPAQQITHYANCDGNTAEPILSANDFTCFINAFAAGCP